MKKLLILICAAAAVSCEPEQDNSRETVEKYILMQLDSMYARVQEMEEAVRTDKELSEIQRQFASARRNYKRIESVSEYYFPNMSEFLNGPALDESEEYDDKVVEPTGFQVIEELIFQENDSFIKNETLKEINILLNGKKRFTQLIKDIKLNDQNVFEAVRLQLLRIASLGISGFDSPVAQHSVPEALAALQGIENILMAGDPGSFQNPETEVMSESFEDAYLFLGANTDFNTFDRAKFLKNHLIPLAKIIYEYQQRRNIPNNKLPTAVNMRESNFFSESFLNPAFFTPELQNKPDGGAIELGKTLFFDPILSGNNSRSCASCHLPSKAFADPNRKSVAFNFKREVSRNAPSLINSGFQRQQFWDQRVQFIEDQVNDVIANKDEMHGDMHKSMLMVMKSAQYRDMFRTAFPEKAVHDEHDLQKAIASYVRSLRGLDSNFDLYMRGDESKLGQSEIQGFNLFMGKAKCGTCHFLPLFNGTVPPSYLDTEAEILGVPGEPDTTEATIDPDPGKFNTYQRDLFRNAFKTPSVRNAALTAPYMHNGVFNTLEQVLDFYNRGGGAGIGIELENQTLPADTLGLTKEEEVQIISFIYSLTDTAGLTRIPNALPQFQDKALDARKVGGVY